MVLIKAAHRYGLCLKQNAEYSSW